MLGAVLRVPETEAHGPFNVLVVPQSNQVNKAWLLLQGRQHLIAHLVG